MGRSPCCEKEHTNKGAWTKDEDNLLIHHIRLHGQGCWRSLPKAAGLLRCGKSCRLRWINYLRPDLKRGNFTPEEDDLIIKLHSVLGNKWSSIAGRLPGRTDNEIKNYWNTHIKRKLIGLGIDPVTHGLLNSSPAAVPAPQTPISRSSSSSGTTAEEDQKSCEVRHQNDYKVNLELSIGLAPSEVRNVSCSSYDGRDHGRVTCLVCGLGCLGNGMCRNCQGGVHGSGLFGYNM